VARIPTILISPRLDEQRQLQSRWNGSGNGRGDQSGYQRSSTYGGVEPPIGPTPWLLRDFIPPVYSWVGSGDNSGDNGDEDGGGGGRGKTVVLEGKGGVISYQHQFTNSDRTSSRLDNIGPFGSSNYANTSADNNNKELFPHYYYSRIAMSQTVMESGHPWRLFVVGGALEGDHDDYKYDYDRDHHNHGERRSDGDDNELPIRYVGSTNNAAGRPTRDIVHEILSVWIRDRARRGGGGGGGYGNGGQAPDR